MAITKEGINNARNLMKNMQDITDSILEEAKLIKSLIDENPEYSSFCIDTQIGGKYNERLDDFIRALNKIGDVSMTMIESTDNYLNNQDAVNNSKEQEEVSTNAMPQSMNLNNLITRI